MLSVVESARSYSVKAIEPTVERFSLVRRVRQSDGTRVPSHNCPKMISPADSVIGYSMFAVLCYFGYHILRRYRYICAA